MKLIKERLGKKAKRLYIQDKELRDTQFAPGKHFSYEIDNISKKVRISLTNHSKNTVSKRMIKDGVKPVIDIRDSQVMNVFKNSEKLKIEIYEEYILVEGLIDSSSVHESTKEDYKNLKKSCKILTFSKLEKSKNKYALLLKKDKLAKIVGLEGQISIFDYVEDIQTSFSSNSANVIDFKKALNDLRIPLNIVSLYSGAGALDKGFIDAGFSVEFALDIDEGAVETYRHNIGDHMVHENLLSYELDKIPKAPCMIAGPFCKRFSQANRKNNIIYSLDKSDKLLNHPDNILIKRYIDAIKINDKCKVFLIENVPQMITVGLQKDGVKVTLLDEIIEELSDFEITAFVLNSADYGSAQKRKRAIVIGSKIGRIEIPKITHDPSNYVTVKDAFKGITPNSPNQNDYSKPKGMTLERIKRVPQGGNWRDIPDYLKTEQELKPNSSKHAASLRRLSWDECAPTVTNIRKCITIHPDEHRILSVREAASLFDLPYDYEFKGTLASMQEQVANMVPRKLSLAVANVIREAIEKYNKKYAVATL